MLGLPLNYCHTFVEVTQTMINIFPWGGPRRFHAHAEVLRKYFGSRVQKLTVDAGFSCPNRDGRLGTEGCTFCDNRAFNPSYCTPDKSIRTQLLEGIEFHARRYRRAAAYLAYFQAFTNTYAPVSLLQSRYEEALSVPGVMGLVIGTRPDCLDNEVVERLRQFSLHTYVSVEVGVESFSDVSLTRIKRGHDVKASVEAIQHLAEAGLHTAIHIIFGLPPESREEMIAQAGLISTLPVKSLKIHQLQLIKGTEMEKQYLASPTDFHLFELEEYIDLVISFLERLSPAIAIERLAAEAPPRYLVVSPFGTMRYDEVLRRIESKMEALNTFQGRLFQS